MQLCLMAAIPATGQTSKARGIGLEPAVHRTIVVVDIQQFTASQRGNHQQVRMRQAMYQALEQAFARSGISWDGCQHEDRGDGVLVLAPPEVPKASFAGL